MNLKQTVMGLSVAAMVMGVTTAFAQESATDEAAEVYSRPNEFYLFNSDDSQSMHFSRARTLRICDKLAKSGTLDRSGKVALKVEYDGNNVTVQPGACKELTARHIEISSAGVMPSSVDLVGTVETKMG